MREREPRSIRALRAVKILHGDGGTLREKERRILAAAVATGLTRQAVEKLYFRWIVYPLALILEECR